MLYNNDSIHCSIGMVVMGTNLSTEAIVISIYGGTSWTQITDRMLIGASSTYTVNATGGSTTHTIASGELPAHTHSIPALSGTAASAGAHTHTVVNKAIYNNGFYGAYITTQSSGNIGILSKSGSSDIIAASAGAHTHSVTTVANTSGSTGSGTAMSILNPYYAVYIWIRTA